MKKWEEMQRLRSYNNKVKNAKSQLSQPKSQRLPIEQRNSSIKSIK